MELRIHIMLFFPDVASLRSLVHASPSYHATYVAGARPKIFSHLVIKQLDDRLHVDALSTVRSRDFYKYGERDPNEVMAFLDGYSRVRRSSRFRPIQADGLFGSEKSCSFEEVIELHLVHVRVSRIIDDYCRSNPRWQSNSRCLSEWERIRLYRAICRYQTYCNLFGPEQKMEKAPLPLDDRGIDFEAVDSFLPNFLPWEVQEMACIYKYLITRWAYLLREICLSEPEEPKTVDESASELDWDNLFAHIRSLPISCQGIFLIAYELCLVPG